jgi:uncharacterized protein YggU (UPF0235/DUF167 family)
MDLPVRKVAGRVEIRVRLTPKSSADRVEGLATASDGTAYLAARVRAVPEKGAANTALERLVAEWLGVPRRSVSVTAGGTSRIKTVSIEGDPAALARRMAELLPDR